MSYAIVAFFSWLFGLLLGGLIMQRVVKDNAEHAVRQDFRVSLDRKAAVIARIRGCPVEWVLDEMMREREESARDA